MNTDTYYIPVNFTNAGRILGLFEIRNLIEALLLCLPVLYVCLTYLPFSLTPKIIVTVSLVVPIGGFGLKGWWAWHCRRRMMFFRGVVTA